MFDTEELDLESFQVVSGKLVVSDPCYERGIWCAGTLENVRNGEWDAKACYVEAEDWGRRVARLTITHQECPPDDELSRDDAPFEVGVDSGQAGFFDDTHYRDNSIVPDVQSVFGDPWYSHCCHITLAKTRAGVLPYGAVSSSGFGDGGYGCAVYRDRSGYIVKAEIEFITEDDLEDEGRAEE